jgi:hypothetical protein
LAPEVPHDFLQVRGEELIHEKKISNWELSIGIAPNLLLGELFMPAWLAQQEDENKVGRAILRASLGQPRQPSQRAQSARSTFALP